MSRKQAALIALALFVLAVVLRLPHLGDFLTPDEQRIWTTLTGEFMAALLGGDWAGTATSGYPGVTTTWAGSAGLTLQYLLDRPEDVDSLAGMAAALLADPTRLDMLPWVRLGVVLTGALGIATIWLLARRLLGDWAALLAAALLTFDPFLLAHTRILNTDPLLAIFLAVSWMALLLATRERKQGWFMLGGAALGLAVLTKTPGLVLAPLAVIWIIWQAGHRGRTLGEVTRAGLRDLLWYGLPALMVVVLLWPALWVAPLPALQRVWNFTAVLSQTGHELGNYWLGRPVAGPGPLFYGAALLWRTTPVTLIGLGLAIVAAVNWASLRGRSRSAAAIPPGDRQDAPTGPDVLAARPQARTLLLFCVWFGLAMTVSPKKFDRYLLPIFPVVDVLAAWGWVVASAWVLGSARSRVQGAKYAGGWRKEASRTGRSRALAAVAVKLVVVQAGYALWHLPTYLTAYNPLVGGIRAAEKVMLVGWGEGLEEAAAFLNQRDGAAVNGAMEDVESAAVDRRAAAWYGHNVFGPFFAGESYDLYYDLPTAGDLYAADVDFVVTYVNQLQRGMLDESVRARLDQPLMSSKWGPVSLAQVYAWPKPFDHTADREMAPGLRLLGWHVEAYEPASRILPVTLYWDATAAATEQSLPPVLVWMKDDAGEVWATVTQAVAEPETEPVAGWLDRPALAQRFLLDVPIGLLPGLYRLEVAAEAGTALALDPLSIPATRVDEIGAIDLYGMQAPSGEPVFADTYRLYSYAVDEGNGGVVLDLLWDAQAPPTPRVKFFVHLTDRDGQIVAQHDATLAARPNEAPVAWTAPQLIRQRIRLNAPALAASGPLVVYMGLYDADTGQRLPLAVEGQPVPDGRLLLAELTGD